MTQSRAHFSIFILYGGCLPHSLGGQCSPFLRTRDLIFNDITALSWSETMWILSLRPFPLGPQLAAPSEQFETVRGGPLWETKSSLDPIKLRVCWWPGVFALATVLRQWEKIFRGPENGKRRVPGKSVSLPVTYVVQRALKIKEAIKEVKKAIKRCLNGGNTQSSFLYNKRHVGYGFVRLASKCRCYSDSWWKSKLLGKSHIQSNRLTCEPCQVCNKFQ